MKFLKHVEITELLNITNGRTRRRSKASTQYANATADQTAKVLSEHREQIQLQILDALRGNLCKTRQSGIALNSYIGTTLLHVILSGMDYQKNGKSAGQYNINRYLYKYPPSKEQSQQILQKYMEGYDAEVQIMLSNLKGYAAQTK